MTFTATKTLTGRTSQSALTIYATLTVDGTTPHATYRDTLLVEGPSSVYYGTLTFPDGFTGWIVFHQTQVGVASDFSGVTQLALEEVNGVGGAGVTNLRVEDSAITVE